MLRWIHMYLPRLDRMLVALGFEVGAANLPAAPMISVYV